MDNQFQKDYERFKNLSYEDFKALAQDESLSVYQKIGFPDSYRKDKEQYIFKDIIAKMQMEGESGKVIMDIGCGCSDLVNYIIDYAISCKNKLLLVDSKEMLALVKDDTVIEKYSGYFPDDTTEIINNYSGKVDYIICYSIFHYVFYNTCMFRFLDIAVSMLKPGGRLLLADIPNVNKRKRFYSTERGVKMHQEFKGDDSVPEFQHNVLEPAQIDDSVVFAIMQRYRNFGFETYLLQQPEHLPMWNRREDILIQRS